jgi:malonyl-CoA O-methyltransferase
MLSLTDTVYDCVISNFALQWAHDLNHAIKFLKAKSSQVFAFSTLLDGTFSEWEKLLNQYQPIKLLQYPDSRTLVNLCHQLKHDHQLFRHGLRQMRVSFDNPKAFMVYLKLLGASVSNNCMSYKNLKALLNAPHQTLTVTYQVFFGLFTPL